MMPLRRRRVISAGIVGLKRRYTMLFNSSLTTAKVLSVFTEEIAARGGTVMNTHDFGDRLFTRSVLPLVEQVLTGDELQGGVALRTTDQAIELSPYIFRLICQNGAIVAQRLESLSLDDLHLLKVDEALQTIRDGVEVCSVPEVFKDVFSRFRRSRDMKADLTLRSLRQWLSRLPQPENADLVSKIMDRFLRGSDPSRYGLANAVTSVARDARAPELRWDLEKLGCAIAIGEDPLHSTKEERQLPAHLRRLVEVG
jgi:hypothetical protein